MVVLFVSPVERTSPQGRDKQTYSYIDERTGELKIGQAMKKTRGSGSSVRLTFQPDYNSFSYKTGLEEQIENPFYKIENRPYNDSPKITIANLLEIEHNLEKGSLHSGMTSNLFEAQFGKNQTLSKGSEIERFSIDLYDDTNRFTDQTLRGRLAIQLIKNHPRIAQSKSEVNPVIHWFYISEENEAQVEKMKKQDIIDRAIAEKYILLNQGSAFKAYQITSLCKWKDGRTAIKGDASADLVKQQLNAFLDTGSQQMSNIAKFLDLIELTKSKEGRSRIEAKYLIQQAFNTKVLDLNEGFIIWPSKVNVATLYKFKDADKFENLILNDMLNYNPEDSDTLNVYGELLKECIQKGVRVE